MSHLNPAPADSDVVLSPPGDPSCLVVNGSAPAVRANLFPSYFRKHIPVMGTALVPKGSDIAQELSTWGEGCTEVG